MDYITAGESHGAALTAIVSKVPAGLTIDQNSINDDLRRRQKGYGRGGRQSIEEDKVFISSGVRFGKSIGSPIALQLPNKDAANWQDRMAVAGQAPADLHREVTPRPGHADLVGSLKQNTHDCRDILERASARETAIRVAAAGIAREFLAELGVEITSYVTRIGSVAMPETAGITYSALEVELSEVRCPDRDCSARMIKEIDAARAAGDSLGGCFTVVATGLVPGLGSYTQPSLRLTSRIAAALCSIPAIKGIEIGNAFELATMPGSLVHDPIQLSDEGFTRSSNNAGGLEGGMTTGLPLVVHGAMKPIPTLCKPLDTINLDSLERAQASRERSDVCAVPSAAIVAEAELAFVLAEAYQEQFGYGCMQDVQHNLSAYRDRIAAMYNKEA